MTTHGYLLLPLACALIYSMSALLLKRAIQGGVGPWRLTVVNAWLIAGVFLPLLVLPGCAWNELIWWQPLASGALSLIGNTLALLALSRGDVSVATPILGTKVILVALMTELILHQVVPLTWWVAAVLASLGVVLLRSHPTQSRGHLAATVGYSLASALCFAVNDVWIQKWVPPAQFTRFMPVMFASAAVLSLGLVPFFRASLFSIPRNIWQPLGLGSVLLGVQALLFVYSLSKFGRATALNIAYSSRGVWSVVLVWAIGHWFQNEERDAGHQVMFSRLAGAALVLVAVALVMV